VIAVAACGADEPAPEPATAQPIVVAALGDSITSGSPGYDPDPAARAALGFDNDERSQYEYWAKRADPRLEFRNCGVYGERTDEIATRLDGCAQGADVLVVQGGINDLAQGRAVSDAGADLRSIVRSGKRLGLEVALANVLPWNNGHPAADRSIAELNRRIAAIADTERVRLLDFHAALRDPSRAGLMPPGMTADGDHPSVAGYRVLGELVARRLAATSADPGGG